MYLIVGLGNPGKQYENTRHNLGFRVVEKLAHLLNAVKPSCRFEALVARTTYKGQPVMLVQPLTYMNLSGRAVLALARYYKTGLEHLLVICDDLALPAGLLRLRPQGTSGGHRGLQSIIDCLGTNEFARLRIGIGSAPANFEPAAYVLLQPAAEEQTTLDEAVNSAAAAALLFIEKGPEAAMNQFNRKS